VTEASKRCIHGLTLAKSDRFILSAEIQGLDKDLDNKEEINCAKNAPWMQQDRVYTVTTETAAKIT
jgi:hypothetical protein